MRPTTWAVSVNGSEAAPEQACEPALTLSTPAIAQSGSHIATGARSAAAAPARASRQVRADGPCQSSATK